MQHHWPIINLKQVDSTNNYARLLIKNNELTEETVVNTYCQEKGRGQQDNTWESEPGKNLTFTLVLFTRYLKAEKQFFLAQAVSLGIVNFLQSQKIKALIKWPNDIYAEGKKIAGILIENSVLNDSLIYSLVGIGLNVNQQRFDNLQNVLSMKNLTKTEYDLNRLLQQLLFYLGRQIDRLKNNKFSELKHDYIIYLYKFEKKCKFSSNRKIFSGKIVDIDEIGRLIILKDDGTKQGFMFKEVQYID